MKRAVLVCLAAMAVTGCTQTARYDWGGYDQALYKYYRDPAAADAYAAKLADAIKQGQADGKLAPGLHAEYGYMLMTSGRSADAVAQFEAEKAQWPESKRLMDRMIQLASDRQRPADRPAARQQELTQ